MENIKFNAFIILERDWLYQETLAHWYNSSKFWIFTDSEWNCYFFTVAVCCRDATHLYNIAPTTARSDIV